MNKLTASICILFLSIFGHISTAQLRVGKISNVSLTDDSKNTNGIQFTPSGILKNSESGGSKSIKNEPAPVITNSDIIINSVLEGSTAIIERLTGIQFKYAMMLNINAESLKNLSLLNLIDNWFGTRYKMGGTTKKGIDCSALTSTFLLTIYGLSVPRTAREQYKASEHINKKDLQQGDLVFFNTHGGVSHVGVYIANNYFVHASCSRGVTISSLDESYYAKRFICGGRVEED